MSSLALSPCSHVGTSLGAVFASLARGQLVESFELDLTSCINTSLLIPVQLSKLDRTSCTSTRLVRPHTSWTGLNELVQRTRLVQACTSTSSYAKTYTYVYAHCLKYRARTLREVALDDALLYQGSKIMKESQAERMATNARRYAPAS